MNYYFIIFHIKFFIKLINKIFSRFIRIFLSKLENLFFFIVLFSKFTNQLPKIYKQPSELPR